MELLGIAALLGLIPAAIARNKGKSFGAWWIYGTLLLIVALPHAIIMRPDRTGMDRLAFEQGLRQCPYCAEPIRPEAVVCRYCGRDVPPLPRSETVAVPLMPAMVAVLVIGLAVLILVALGGAMR